MPICRLQGLVGLPGSRHSALIRQLYPASGKQVIHLTTGIRARIGQSVLDCSVIFVQNPQRKIYTGNGVINLSIEYPISPADYGLVVVEGIPRERNSGGKVVPGRAQRKVLRVQFIADAIG